VLDALSDSCFVEWIHNPLASAALADRPIPGSSRACSRRERIIIIRGGSVGGN
jgi:hypothetical protein